ncbi:MAG TPA: anaerobic nitric oxide reductase flavorubredoxin [Atribacter sp.]|jgi:anaerobic nitric oxide reductase flavorubredoxin|uniref:Anaerobic nitric oxide reductase flavorubredoxin n=1 Tax=Candidatus Atribacter allofermentans TaxID=1852833 RepID=A0A1V5SV17_9BACT|nr:anaerobic nitric oxide reductase flavorubredoxin [Atribacter sp.]MDD3714243.1 anaerobic nitric oxide reductase flavorubredoxin [Atribacterota bacterium]MDI9595617.1 anaerobic nitric oxide reductase flavorubredoxin [Atribacterota bacterium]OQA58031.1 MAG: Anaerobic nitric oxide reductase flavorubredoxin [Candidatus Atribacteria bacterium ADurb.Bin276]HQK83006.1 anaerobic nitric oxide reductase flavorubredoxin [Atribacter sp.]
MKKKIKNQVFWVGKVDWELRKFHGDEFSTHHGSTYNSYLIQEEKNVLIDTVWIPFAEEFVENLAQEIDLNKIDYIVANHGEVDHSGALPALMKHIPNAPIYCTANAVKSLKGQYHQDWNFHVVKTGDKISIGGGKELVFVEMPMLHWPDSMATYMTEDNILFSNDAFGQHFATDKLYNDLVDQCDLFKEAIKYYANILTPFSQILKKKLEEVLSLNLTIDIIATSHGVIWRDNPLQIVEKYSQWANDYQENQITIIYDTMWNGTKKLAEKIAEGIEIVDPDVEVKVFNLTKSDQNDLITEVFKSKKVVIGSPTINNTILHSIAGFIQLMKQMKFKGKKATSFGCYGWSGESTKILNEALANAGFEVIEEGFRNQWNPDDGRQIEAIEFGKKIAKA